jgi:uncharacterized protein YeaO (DUF488 family)
MSPSAVMAPGRVATARWNDPLPKGGTRILVCRYRPRGVRKEAETWDEWCAELGPSRELHAAVYGKGQPPISWSEYRRRYLTELAENPARFHMRALVDRVAGGESVVLLCSSACTDETECHRSILHELLTEPRRRQ